jgi:hypothetical protein
VAVRPWDRGVPTTVVGRRTLARVLTAPAESGDDGEYAMSGPVAGRRAFEGLSGLDVTAAQRAPGPTARWRALEGPSGLDVLTGRTAYGPEVLEPTRVTPGRPATCPPEEAAHRLGETTDRLLRHHLREGRPRRARQPLPDASSSTTEIPGREWRSLPGVQAGALTPRGR